MGKDKGNKKTPQFGIWKNCRMEKTICKNYEEKLEKHWLPKCFILLDSLPAVKNGSK